MAIVEDQAFEVENGVSFTEQNESNVGPFLTGGASSPIGLDLSINTLYYQNDGTRVIVWQKFDTGVNDWRAYPAGDISYDPTGLPNFDPSDTDVKKALDRIGSFSVQDIAEIEGFVSNNTETTTSNNWVSKTGFPWTSASVKSSGIWSLRWFAEVGQTKEGRLFGFRIRWRATGDDWSILSEIPEAAVSIDDGLIQQSGFKEVALAADNTIEMDVQYGQTDSGFSAIISNVSVEIRRLGDL